MNQRLITIIRFLYNKQSKTLIDKTIDTYNHFIAQSIIASAKASKYPCPYFKSGSI